MHNAGVQLSALATLFWEPWPGGLPSSGLPWRQLVSPYVTVAAGAVDVLVASLHFDRPDSKPSSKTVVGEVGDAPGHGAAEDAPEAPDGPGAGHWLAGAGRGATVTVNEALPVLPALSVAVHLTVAVPTANVLPLAGSHAGVIEPSTASLAVTAYSTVAPAAEVAVNKASINRMSTLSGVENGSMRSPAPMKIKAAAADATTCPGNNRMDASRLSNESRSM